MQGDSSRQIDSDGASPRPVDPRSVQSRRRNAGLDWLRVLAVAGVVQFHCNPPGGIFERSALVIFIGISVLLEFMISGRRTRTVRALARGSLLPWFCWSMLYAVRNLAKGEMPIPLDAPLMRLLTGTTTHLWYMPFYFALSLVIMAVKPRAGSRVMLWGLFLIAAGAQITAPAWWQGGSMSAGADVPFPISSWILVLPTSLVLLASGYALANSNLPGAFLVPLALYALTAVMWMVSPIELYRLILFGCGCLAAAWILGERVPDLPIVSKLSQAAFGVYLSHILVLGVLRVVAARVAHYELTPSAGLGLAVTSASFALVLTLHHRAPALRPYLG